MPQHVHILTKVWDRRPGRRCHWGVCSGLKTTISCKSKHCKLKKSFLSKPSFYVPLLGLGGQRVGDKLHGGPGLNEILFNRLYPLSGGNHGKHPDDQGSVLGHPQQGHGGQEF